jgi:hypothetical protein
MRIKCRFCSWGWTVRTIPDGMSGQEWGSFHVLEHVKEEHPEEYKKIREAIKNDFPKRR